MKNLGVGIIGTGGIANGGHAPAVNAVEQTSLVAVLSRDSNRGKEFLQKHNVVGGRAHTDLDSFVNDNEIELVIICSPDRLHAIQAAACIRAGKHVLLEKPMAISQAEAQELIKLADENNVVLAIGFHHRSHAGLRSLRQKLIEQKAIGALRHIRVIWAKPRTDDRDWRAQEELGKWWSLSAVGSHCIDLARWFSEDKDEWKQFSSVISRDVWKGPHDETAVIASQLSSGPTVEIVSSVQFGPLNRIELYGDAGYGICENTMGRDGAGVIRLNDKPLNFEPTNPFATQLTDLVNNIKTNKTPSADGSVGLRSVQDLLLAYDV